MKNILLLTILLLSSGIYAQHTENDSIKPQRQYFKMYYVYPNGIGNNVLAKANKGDYGLGFAFTFVDYRNFQLNGGIKYLQFNITDKSLSTTADNTKMSSVYAEVSYKIPVINKLTINPQLSFGNQDINLGGGPFNVFGDSKGRQHGVVFGGGFDADYELDEHVKVFIGGIYSLTRVHTNTSAQYKDFYSKLGQINIIAGLKF